MNLERYWREGSYGGKEKAISFDSKRIAYLQKVSTSKLLIRNYSERSEWLDNTALKKVLNSFPSNGSDAVVKMVLNKKVTRRGILTFGAFAVASLAGCATNRTIFEPKDKISLPKISVPEYSVFRESAVAGKIAEKVERIVEGQEYLPEEIPGFGKYAIGTYKKTQSSGITYLLSLVSTEREFKAERQSNLSAKPLLQKVEYIVMAHFKSPEKLENSKQEIKTSLFVNALISKASGNFFLGQRKGKIMSANETRIHGGFTNIDYSISFLDTDEPVASITSYHVYAHADRTEGKNLYLPNHFGDITGEQNLKDYLDQLGITRILNL